MKPTRATVDVWAARLGVKVPSNAQTPVEAWAFLSGFAGGAYAATPGPHTYATAILFEDGKALAKARRDARPCGCWREKRGKGCDC